MRARQGLDLATAGVGQPDPDDALVVDVLDTLHQTRGDGPIHELDDAVMPEQQVLGQLPNRRRPTVAADCQKQLVLRTGQPHCPGLGLAPTQETS